MQERFQQEPQQPSVVQRMEFNIIYIMRSWQSAWLLWVVPSLWLCITTWPNGEPGRL